MIGSTFEADLEHFYDVEDTESVANFKGLVRSLITPGSSGVFDHQHSVHHGSKSQSNGRSKNAIVPTVLVDGSGQVGSHWESHENKEVQKGDSGGPGSIPTDVRDITVYANQKGCESTKNTTQASEQNVVG